MAQPNKSAARPAKPASELSLRAQQLISGAFRNGDPTKTLWRQLQDLKRVSGDPNYPSFNEATKPDIPALEEAIEWLDGGGNIEDIRKALESGYHYGSKKAALNIEEYFRMFDENWQSYDQGAVRSVGEGSAPDDMMLEEFGEDLAQIGEVPSIREGYTIAQKWRAARWPGVNFDEEPKMAADMIHSDNELSSKMEPAAPAPEAGPSNTELVENSHSENGASPVLDGDLHSPERANVNAVREALETQAEMEVGKPINQKQEEIKAEGEGKSMEIDAKPGKQIIINIAGQKTAVGDAPLPPASEWAKLKSTIPSWEIVFVDDSYRYVNHDLQLLTHGFGIKEGLERNADILRVDANTLKMMREKYLKSFPKKEASAQVPAEAIGGEDQGKITSGHGGGMFGGTDLHQGPSWDYPGKKAASLKKAAINIDELKKAGRQFIKFVRTAAISVLQGRDAEGFHMTILMEGKEYVLRGDDADQFRREYNAIQKPEAKVNALVEKYLWKLQPYGATVKPKRERMAPAKITQTAPINQGGIPEWLKKKDTEDAYSKQKSEPALVRHSSKEAGYEDGTYEGWSNWETWHVALLINNTESTYNTKRRLCQNALKKNMGAKQFAEQLSRMFKSQADETQQLHDQNGDNSRDARGAFERKQLDGWQPANEEEGLRHKVDELFYSVGDKSDWEKPFGQINWEEIAENFLESERDELKATGKAVPEAPKKESKDLSKLELTDEDQAFMKDMKIQGSKKRIDMAEKLAGTGTTKNETDIEKEAGFNFFFPGQVLKEFYPEIQHEIVDYPNASNSPMQHAPEMVGDGGHEMDAMIDNALDNVSIVEAIELPGDVTDLKPLTAADYSSTSPAGGMGIGRDGKPQIQEGVPLRKENDIRGPMFTDEFYGQYQGVNGKSLAIASLKTAAGTEIEQFGMFLKKVMGEIAATMTSAFKVTSRPLLDKVPGVGEVQLALVEQPQGMSSYNVVNTGSRVKYLMDKLNDSEIQDAINDSWAQAAVWHDGPKGGYVYEVFVRAESIDTDSMIMKYKFVAGTRE